MGAAFPQLRSTVTLPESGLVHLDRWRPGQDIDPEGQRVGLTTWGGVGRLR